MRVCPLAVCSASAGSSLIADGAYCLWAISAYDEKHLPSWHAGLNAFLYWGGGILFVLLLLGSYLVWRVKQGERLG